MAAVKEIKVLLVEDEQIDQLAIERLIQKYDLPYILTIASSLEEARNCLKTKEYDIVLLDYMLKDGTAFDLLKDPLKIPVIMHTGAGNEEIAVRALKSGVYDYLIKNSELSYLNKLPVIINKAIKHKEVTEAYNNLFNLYETIISNSFDGFFITDIKGNICFVNNAGVQLTRYSSEELAKLNIGGLILGNEYISQLPHLSGEKKSIKKLKLMLTPKNGPEIPVEVSISLISVDTNRVLFCIRDLRPNPQIQDELAQLKRVIGEKIRVILFSVGEKGPEAILWESLPIKKEKEKDILFKIAIYYSTTLVQGYVTDDNLGLFGPLPVPDISDYSGITYSFEIKNPKGDIRDKDRSYSFLVFLIPKALESLFSNKTSISKTLSNILLKKNSIENFDMLTLKFIKYHIISTEIRSEGKPKDSKNNFPLYTPS